MYNKENVKDLSVKSASNAEVTESGCKVSIVEAARLNRVTRQAIYLAIKQKKLKAYKNPVRWMIDLADLEEYRKQRYSRAKSLYDGELVFDPEKGYYSVNQVARALGVPVQKIYYAVRIELLKAERKGSAWVIHVDEVERYKREYLLKPRRRSKKGVLQAEDVLNNADHLDQAEQPQEALCGV